jgi:DNA polymerase-3 subunit gamma/tau
MKSILISAALMAVLASGSALAQDTPPNSNNPSIPATQPQAEPATPTPAQPQQQPQSPQTPQTSQAPSAHPSATQAQAASGIRIAPGSVIPVQLTKTIDAKKAKPGDEVVAKVTMDMKTNSGEVVVPKDTKVVGHVTEAQARNKEQKESQVGIAFDHAVLKNGDVNLPMSIQAVIAPPSNNGNSGGGVDQGAPAGGGATATSSMGGGRSGSTGSAGQSQASASAPNSVPTTGTDNQQQGNARPPINGNTQGVVGISDLKLEAGQNITQGSVLSSEKNNVKVESGTMLLLRVSQ